MSEALAFVDSSKPFPVVVVRFTVGICNSSAPTFLPMRPSPPPLAECCLLSWENYCQLFVFFRNSSAVRPPQATWSLTLKRVDARAVHVMEWMFMSVVSRVLVGRQAEFGAGSCRKNRWCWCVGEIPLPGMRVTPQKTRKPRI